LNRQTGESAVNIGAPKQKVDLLGICSARDAPAAFNALVTVQ
jgi:hypothetical protein